MARPTATTLKEWEPKILKGMAISIVIGFFIMIISVATDYWLIIDLKSGYFRNRTNSYLLKSYSGLWRICRVELTNVTGGFKKTEQCQSVNMFPTSHELHADPGLDHELLNYTRSMSAFAVIGLVLMVMGIFFAFYSLRQPRYMFKRLAAVIHVMAAVCILVCIEVLMTSMEYASNHLPSRFPKDSSLHYGFSYAFAWIVFFIYLASGITFLICSRKRKKDDAVTVDPMLEQNEPVSLGRV